MTITCPYDIPTIKAHATRVCRKTVYLAQDCPLLDDRLLTTDCKVNNSTTTAKILVVRAGWPTARHAKGNSTARYSLSISVCPSND